MSIFTGILAGLGAAGSNIADSNTKLWNEQAINQQKAEIEQGAIQQRADLEEQKQKNILSYQQKLAQAPMDAASKYIQQAASQNVPIEAAPVTRLDQAGATAAGLQTGIQGDLSGEIGAQISKFTRVLNNPKASEEDKQTAQDIINQITKQSGAQNQLAKDSVAGQTRQAENPEILKNAMASALRDNNPIAYSALKQMAGEKYISLGDGNALNTVTGEVSQSGSTKQERQEKSLAASSDRQEKALAAAAERQDKTFAEQERLRTGAMIPQDQIDKDAAMIANYKKLPYGSASRDSPRAALVMSRVSDLNPDFDAKHYKTIQKVDNDFATGKEGGTVRSINAVTQHLSLYGQLAEALDNGDIQLINQAKAAIGKAFGTAPPTDLAAASRLLGPEVNKVFVPGGGGEREREALQSDFSNAKSPAQAKSLVNTFGAFMAGQANALQQQYVAVPGVSKDSRIKEFQEKLLPETMAFMNAHGYGNSTATLSNASSSTTANPMRRATDNNGWSNLRVN